jgi:hypothetical protein
MKLTANDKRVLRAIEVTCQDLDGFIPHGASDWLAARRLQAKGLATSTDFGMCETCRESHEGLLYVLIHPIALEFL